MSEEAEMVIDGAEKPVEAQAPAQEVLTQEVALQRVLKYAMVADGLKRGAHEVAKALAKAQAGTNVAGAARLVVLSQSCDEQSLKKLIKALAAEKGVPLIEISSGATLGQYAGLCKIDREGNPRHVVSTACVAVTDFGVESAELNFLLKQ
jgi:small subunit ribosomal protein S12e